MIALSASVEQATPSGDFCLRDCALIAIATGVSVLTLREFREGLRHIPPASIYHHFWGGLLQPRFEEREYNNDFAAWVRHGLHDPVLAERLALVDPTGYQTIEALRQCLIELVDERLDENERMPWLVASQPFEFVRTQTVVFDTRTRVASPEMLGKLMPALSTGSIFYHFIDARRRPPIGVDDFGAWLLAWGTRYEEPARRMADLDPYFGSLTELRRRLAEVLESYCGEEPP